MYNVVAIVGLLMSVAVGVFSFVLFARDKFYGYLMMMAGAVLAIFHYLGCWISFGEVGWFFMLLSCVGMGGGFIIIAQVKVLGRPLGTIHGTLFGGFQEMGAAAKRAAEQAKAHEKPKGEGEETK